MIELFHFLRPGWLAALPLVAIVWYLVRRREASSPQTLRAIAPHLRSALTIGRGAQSALRAVDGVCLALLLLALAAAGPAWNREKSPWFTESAPLVIALEVSDSMRSNDLQPTRLDRARFKIRDIVAARSGGQTALIAYAGSAHIVMPPTSDAQVLRPFLEGLDPALMPVPGADAGAALKLALQLLGEQAAGATVLFINDGFAATDIPALENAMAAPEVPALAALVVGTDAGGVALMPDGSVATGADGGMIDTRVDSAVLKRAASVSGMRVVRASSDASDLRTLLRFIASSLRRADNPDARWRDQGWWLLWPAALLALLWFRRGWTMQW